MWLRGMRSRTVRFRAVRLRDVRLCEMWLCGLRLRDVRLCEMWLCDLRLRDVRLCEMRLCGVRLRDVRLCEVWLCAVRLRHVRLRAVRLGLVRFREMRLCGVRLRDVRHCTVRLRAVRADVGWRAVDPLHAHMRRARIGLGRGGREGGRGIARDLEDRLVRADPDRANFTPGHAAAPADERQQPPGIRLVLATQFRENAGASPGVRVNLGGKDQADPGGALPRLPASGATGVARRTIFGSRAMPHRPCGRVDARLPAKRQNRPHGLEYVAGEARKYKSPLPAARLVRLPIPRSAASQTTSSRTPNTRHVLCHDTGKIIYSACADDLAQTARKRDGDRRQRAWANGAATQRRELHVEEIGPRQQGMTCSGSSPARRICWLDPPSCVATCDVVRQDIAIQNCKVRELSQTGHRRKRSTTVVDSFIRPSERVALAAQYAPLPCSTSQ